MTSDSRRYVQRTMPPCCTGCRVRTPCATASTITCCGGRRRRMRHSRRHLCTFLLFVVALNRLREGEASTQAKPHSLSVWQARGRAERAGPAGAMKWGFGTSPGERPEAWSVRIPVRRPLRWLPFFALRHHARHALGTGAWSGGRRPQFLPLQAPGVRERAHAVLAI